MQVVINRIHQPSAKNQNYSCKAANPLSSNFCIGLLAALFVGSMGLANAIENSGDGSESSQTQLQAITPRSLPTNPLIWLVSDQEVNGGAATNNQAVSTWGDFLSTASAAPSIQAPLYRDNATDNINFHPVVFFNNNHNTLTAIQNLKYSNYIYSTSTSTTPTGLTFFMIAKPAIPTTAKASPFVYDFGYYAIDGYGMRYDNNTVGVHAFGNDGINVSTSHSRGQQPTLLSHEINLSTDTNSLRANANVLLVSGLVNDNVINSSNVADAPSQGANQGPFIIGSQSMENGLDLGGGRDYYGTIAEIVGYDGLLSATQKNEIESYLAIKYGITLDQSTVTNYVIEGETIWNANLNTAFNNDIAGLARYYYDTVKVGTLDQRVARSINPDALVTVSSNSDFAANNNSGRPVSIGTTGAVVWGNNNAPVAEFQATGAPQGYVLLSRRWMAQVTNTVTPIQGVQLNAENTNYNVPAPLSGDSYYFIQDSDLDGLLSDETPQAMTNNGSGLHTTANNINFKQGQLFGFASKALAAEFAAVSYSASEGLLTAYITVIVSGGVLSTDASLDLTVSGGTATNLTDYSAPTAITIPAGDYTSQTTINVPITLVNDLIVEGDETVDFSLSSSVLDIQVGDANANATVQSDTVLTIASDDTANVTIADVTVAENASVTATMTLVLNAEVEGGVTVKLNTIDGSAVAPNDYTTTSSDVFFEGDAGNLTKTVSITITNDNAVEPTENFTVSLSNSTVSSVDITDTAIVTITDPDTSSIVVSPATFAENSGGGSYEIRLIQPVQDAVSFTFLTNELPSSDPATAGVDYTTTSQILTFAPMQTSMTVNLVILDDTIVEPTEQFRTQTTASSNPNVSAGSLSTISITDSDTATISIADANIAENGIGVATLTLNNAVQNGVSVTVNSASGTATQGADYTAISQIVTFVGTVGETQSLPITPTDDAVAEGNEMFSLSLASATAPRITISDTAVVTLIDDDIASVTIEDAIFAEGDGVRTYTLTLDKATAQPFTIDLKQDSLTSTAILNDDYSVVTPPARASFAGTIGETQTISFNIVDDTIVEGNEVVGLRLADATLTGINSSDTATATITDNDTATIRVVDLIVDEEAGVANVVLELSAGVPAGVSVDVSTSPGALNPASADVDYTTLTNQTVNFVGGTGEQKIVPITLIDDNIVEVDQTFNVQLSSISDPQVTGVDGVVIIDSNDRASILVDNNSLLVTETVGGTTITVNVLLNAAVEGGLTVDFATLDGADPFDPNRIAETTLDYAANMGTLTFAGNVSEVQSVTLSITDDALKEYNEYLTIELSNPSVSSVNIPEQPVVRILDNEPDLILPDTITAESNGTVSIPVTIAAGSTLPAGFTVDLVLSNDSALAGDDYVDFASTVTLTFATGLAGDSATAVVTLVDDSIVESDETFVATLQNPSDLAAALPYEANNVIVDDDSAGLSIADITVDEAAGFIDVAVTLNQTISTPTTVSVSTQPGTAKTPNDFITTSETLSFSANVLGGETRYLRVPIVDDNITEVEQSFRVVLGAPSNDNVTVTDSLGFVTITDDDIATVTIASEGTNEAAFSSILTLVLNGEVEGAFTVNVTTQPGTATADVDYVTTTRAISFAGTSGEMQTFSSLLVDDDIVEPLERYSVQLLGSTHTNVTANSVGTVDINDNDIAAITLTTITVDESAGVATLRATLDKAVDGGVSATASTSDLSATAGADYTLTTQLLAFSGSVGDFDDITIPINDDTVVENLESFAVTLSGSTNTSVIATDSQTVSITDNDTSAISISNVTVDESAGSATLTLTLLQAVSGGVSVDVITGDDSAIAGSDYNAPAAPTVTFGGSAGETQPISIPIVNDATVEPSEALLISLANVSVITVDETATATVTITDDDSTAVTLGDVTVDETSGVASITLTLSQAVAGGFSVELLSNNGTAIAPQDFTAVDQVVDFLGNLGETQTINIGIINDNRVESTEQFSLSLQNSTLAVADISDTATVSITDNDTSAISIADITVNEVAGTANIQLTLSNPVDGGVSVRIISADGSATQPADYTALSSVVNFAGTMGEVKPVTISIVDDSIVESAETVLLSLADVSPTAVDISDTATLTINDNDSSSLFISAVNVDESAATATITVNLTNAVAAGLSVDIALGNAGDSATAPDDYTTVTPTLTFTGSANEAQSFTVPIVDDSLVEGDEFFSVTMTTAAPMVTASAVGQVTIIDNDETAVLFIPTVQSVLESDGTVTLTLTLTQAVSGGFDISVKTLAQTASEGSDYQALDQIIHFNGTLGETQPVQLTLVDDAIAESDETLQVMLLNPSNPSVQFGSVMEIVILDDDILPSLSLSNTSCQFDTINRYPGAGLFVLPANTAHLYDVVDFELINCNVGDSATVTIVYPDVIPSDAQFMKFALNNTVYEITSAVISGNSVTYTITDGGGLDQDGAADGKILDPVGLIIPTALPVGVAKPIPSTTLWAWISLIGLLSVATAIARRRAMIFK